MMKPRQFERVCDKYTNASNGQRILAEQCDAPKSGLRVHFESTIHRPDSVITGVLS
jgi:hypothetical protein